MVMAIRGLWELRNCSRCNCKRHHHLDKAGSMGRCRKMWCFCSGFIEGKYVEPKEGR